jgi:hypothetical protein
MGSFYFYPYASVLLWSADDLNPQPLPPGPPDPNIYGIIIVGG